MPYYFKTMCNYETLINEQIKRELEASNFYYALHIKFLVSFIGNEKFLQTIFSPNQPIAQN